MEGRLRWRERLQKLPAFLLLAAAALSELVSCSEQINITETATKSYEEEEEGKLLPYRTFLETWEIVVICVCSVILVFLIVLPCVYVCMYGCVMPQCCRRKRNDYSQIQLHRERKIGEIWKQQYRA